MALTVIRGNTDFRGPSLGASSGAGHGSRASSANVGGGVPGPGGDATGPISHPLSAMRLKVGRTVALLMR